MENYDKSRSLESGPIGSLLARVDERTKSIQSNMENIRQDVKIHNDILNAKFDDQSEKVDKLHQGQHEIRADFGKSLDARLKEIREEFEKIYVKKESFSPVQKIVFGLVGLVLTVVFTALFGIVIIK